MGSRQEIAKKRFRMVQNYMRSLLPRINRNGARAVQGISTASLFLMGLAMLMFACALALMPQNAWATQATSSAASSEEAAGNPENTVNARQTADNSFLYDTSIYELSQADATFQGNTVQIVGEVVGDSIRSTEDPGKYWITLEAIEEEYESSISVLVDEDILPIIDTYGGYNRVGTTLQVRGTFYLACPSHEGIMDVHADYVTLVARGSTTADEFRLDDFKVGIVLVGFGLLLALIYRYLRERER